MDEKELRSLLNIGDDVDVKAQIIKLTAGSVALADHEAVKAELVTLTERINERDANEAIDAAIKAGHIVPAQREWAVTTYLSHRDGWNSYLKTAPKVSHLLTETGVTGGSEATPPNAPSREALEIAKVMGVPAEKLSAATEDAGTSKDSPTV